MKKEKYEKNVINPRNRLIICLCYGFTGLNLLASGIYNCVMKPSELMFKYLICLGVVMLVMVPLSYSDDRKGMLGNPYTVVSCIMYLLVNSALYFVLNRLDSPSSFWVIIFCAVEAIFSAIFVYKKSVK